MQQLTESTVIPYLKEKGYITPEEPAAVTFLPSNVNFVYRVDTPTKSFVVKQGRESLARFPDVPCSIRRTETEYRAISVWRTYGNPAAVPHALSYDKENNIIIFAAAPEHAHILTEDLLKGVVDPLLAQQIAALFARVHKNTLYKKKLAKSFQHSDLFDVKIALFHNAMADAAQRREVKNAIDDLLKSLKKNSIALIHADTNSKNILVWNDQFLLIDYECSHYGDPAIDMGNFLAHYLLSTLINFKQRKKYFIAMQEAWNAYEKEFSFSHIQQVKKNVLQHMGAFLWGRTFGKANAPFIQETAKKAIAEISEKLVVGKYQELEEVFALVEQYKELEKVPPLNIKNALKQVSF